MMLYHVNLGFPLLDAGAQPFSSPLRETEAAPANDGSEEPFSPLGTPTRDVVEQVYVHRLEPDEAGFVHAGVFNERLGLAFGLSCEPAVLPYMFEWRVRRAGVYALGLEPSTSGVDGRVGARRDGTLKILEPGESVTYRLVFRAQQHASSLDAVLSNWGVPSLTTTGGTS
jgi:hypothetical protein